MESRKDRNSSRKMAIVGALLVTLLNPHFYLDTIVLLGGLASQFKESKNIYFSWCSIWLFYGFVF